MSRRSSTIRRIMGIEKEKRALTLDKHFNRLQENRVLFNNLINKSVVRIYDPFNLEKMIEVRRDADELVLYRLKNEELLNEYQGRIDSLAREKARLQRRIFG